MPEIKLWLQWPIRALIYVLTWLSYYLVSILICSKLFLRPSQVPADPGTESWLFLFCCPSCWLSQLRHKRYVEEPGRNEAHGLAYCVNIWIGNIMEESLTCQKSRIKGENQNRRDKMNRKGTKCFKFQHWMKQVHTRLKNWGSNQWFQTRWRLVWGNLKTMITPSCCLEGQSNLSAALWTLNVC